jgi:enoyl-CoA hydratase/carnithine racemase
MGQVTATDVASTLGKTWLGAEAGGDAKQLDMLQRGVDLRGRAALSLDACSCAVTEESTDEAVPQASTELAEVSDTHAGDEVPLKSEQTSRRSGLLQGRMTVRRASSRRSVSRTSEA